MLVDCSVMCGRCSGHLVKTGDEIVCVVCGWRSYPIPRRLRLGPRDRAQRRARVRRVALEASARGACHVCGADAVTAKHCRRHQDLNNAAARARLLARRAARLCRNCELPAVSAGLLRWPPRRSQHPAAGAASANRCTGLVVLNVQLLDVDVDRAAVVVWQA